MKITRFCAFFSLVLAPDIYSGGLALASTDFEQNKSIPSRFTCDGENTSPELSWNAVPGAQSYALIMHDPDAPRQNGFTHWLIQNIPSTITHLLSGINNKEKIGNTGIQLANSSGKKGYMGPCPPSGTHRYYIKLYALDIPELPLAENKADLEGKIIGHVLATSELMGTYKRKK